MGNHGLSLLLLGLAFLAIGAQATQFQNQRRECPRHLSFLLEKIIEHGDIHYNVEALKNKVKQHRIDANCYIPQSKTYCPDHSFCTEPTLLALAVKLNKYDIAKALLEDLKADPMVPFKDQGMYNFPIMEAIEGGSTAMFELLIQYGAAKKMDKLMKEHENSAILIQVKNALLEKCASLSVSENMEAEVELYREGNREDLVGTVNLKQIGCGYVKVDGKVEGLTGLHGFHVHAGMSIGNKCKDALGHFNPDGTEHGHPLDSRDERHTGGLGNIEANEKGIAYVNIYDHHISLEETSMYNVMGKAIVIHAGKDDYGLGGVPASKASGNAGPRFACGIIKPKN